jgi:hypothetical protein
MTRQVARNSLLTLAVIGVGLTAACASGSGRSTGQSTLRVSAGPNGEAGKTGPQVLADATRALAAAATVHVVGTTTDGDSKVTANIDLRLQADGGIGSLRSSEGSLQMRYVKGRLYYNGSAAFFESTMALKSTAQAIAGRWVYDDISFGQDPPFTPKGLSEEIADPEGGVKVEPAVATDTLDGQSVVVVREADGSRMYVAATGAPLPLKISTTGGDSGFAAVGNVTLTYDEDRVQLQTPAGAIQAPEPSFAMPSGLPSGFPTDWPSGFPTAFPSGLPSALASELMSFAPFPSGSVAGTATPAPTP